MTSTEKQMEKKTLSLTLKSVEPQTQDQTSDAPLISEVKKRVQTYNERKEEINAEREQKRQEHEKRLEENRQKGTEELTKHLKGLIPEKIKTYANYGKTEARIFEFTFGDELKYSGCYAKDLLSKGTVIADLQAWLDDEHSDDVDGKKQRAFFIYFNMVGRQQHDRNANKYAVFVNWDSASWPSIEQRLERSSNVRAQREGGQRPAPRQRGSNQTGRRTGPRQKVSDQDGQDRDGYRRQRAPRNSDRQSSRTGEGRQSNDTRPRRVYRQKRTDNTVPVAHSEDAE